MDLRINTSPPYEVIFKPGCVMAGTTAELLKEFDAKKFAVITDGNVSAFYLDAVRASLQRLGGVYSYTFAAGEASKSLSTVEKLYEFLSASGITRADLIIALGGGVVGDTAGFAASTYLRGVRYVQLPTTLLAMVDSSVGGKTGVNLSAGKNLVGSFYQPSKVIIDTCLLDTLSRTEWQSGIGEIIKYGAIMDKDLFALMERDKLEDIDDIIYRCLKIKKEITEKDTLDTGLRQILNFGHTLAHAIERHSDYMISHGKAVGAGMALIARWAESRCQTRSGTADRIAAALERHGIAAEYPLAPEKLWEISSNDKKRRGTDITLALVEDIGKGFLYSMPADAFNKTDIDVTVTPSPLGGVIAAPPSKSMAHRAIFCAMLCGEKSVIRNVDLSRDIAATAGAARALGCGVRYEDRTLCIEPSIDVRRDLTAIDCGESGTTLRFLLPVLSALGKTALVDGADRLGERPYSELTAVLSEHGAVFDRTQGLPLGVSGGLSAGDYRIRGDISSQFISGLLLALPLLDGDSRVILCSPPQSAPYIGMTVRCMHEFGVEVYRTDYGYDVPGGQRYKGGDFTVEGDYSSAAFWLCAGALHGDIEVTGLDKRSLQGDKAIIDILRSAGADITETERGYRAKKSSLSGIDIDVSDVPDLAPVLALTLARAEGGSVIRGTSRLKLKECDRQSAIIEIINALGGGAALEGGDIIIDRGMNRGGALSSRNDHRIAMALAVTAVAETTVIGAQTVQKSYPDFFLDYKSLGGKYVVDMGK